jgi:hypothetical protein
MDSSLHQRKKFHWAADLNAQDDPRVMAWCGIWGNRVIGPFFFDEHVNGVSYLKLLSEDFWPVISSIPGISEAFFQQDGAPSHFECKVRAWLNDHFPQRWIGRSGPVEWPARSPDLTPLDFFLWGYVKSKVYPVVPKTLTQLKKNIRNVVRRLNRKPNMLTKVRKAWELRLKHCITIDGEQFEHLIK